MDGWWLRSEIKAYFHLFLFVFLYSSGALTTVWTVNRHQDVGCSHIISLPPVKNIIVRVHASTSSSAVLDDLSRGKVYGLCLDRLRAVTMETRLQVQPCREYSICFCESYTMSQTPETRSISCEYEAIAFLHATILLPLSAPRLNGRLGRCRRVTICLSVSRVKLPTQQVLPSLESLEFFWQAQLLAAYWRARWEPQRQTLSEPVWVHA